MYVRSLSKRPATGFVGRGQMSVSASRVFKHRAPCLTRKCRLSREETQLRDELSVNIRADTACEQKVPGLTNFDVAARKAEL